MSYQISLGYRQIVILRADLDRRIVREPTEGGNYFEIGQDNSLQLQGRYLTSSNTIVNVIDVAGDYLKNDFIHLLSKHHFDCDVPTYFVWEGTTANLKKGSIILMLERIRNQVKRFKLSLGYLSYQIISRTTGNPELDQYMEELEKKNIHWITGFKDMATFARALGLKMVENISTADLYAHYYSTNLLPSKIFRFHFVCTLEYGE
jgi:O-methyltransferase involved in polyketide biosynthesis